MGIKVGNTIKIICLVDEPYNSHYNGKVGVIERIEKDPWGDLRASGSWGGIYIYLDKDEYEVVK